MRSETQEFEVLKGFIVVEGLDGAGTTTQSRMLHAHMQGSGKSSVLTCEPTDSFIGKAVRYVLQDKALVAPGTLAKLFAADRHNHIYHPTEGILQHLEKGATVISDRYLFSSLAYQSVDWEFEEVWGLNRMFPLPEHLIFLDISPEIGQRRIHSRNIPREIYEKKELQDEIRSNYFHAFSLFAKTEMKIHIFDGSLPMEELHEKLLKQVK